MNNLHTLNKSFDYTNLEDRITQLGYQNPAIDSGDRRQRILWKDILKARSVPIKLVQLNREVTSKFATNHSEYHKYFQCRFNSENKEKIAELSKEFFDDQVSLKRLPIAIMVGDELYVSVGNHRTKAFIKGYLDYPDSEITSHFLLIDPENKFSDMEKIRLGKLLADVSNRETGDETQSETAEDISHQIRREVELCKLINPDFFANTSDEQYITDWLLKNKPDTSSELLSRAKNKVFAPHISQSLDTAPIEKLNEQWQQYWSRSTWSPSTSKVKQMHIMSHFNNFKNTLFNNWYDREIFTAKNDRIHLCVRAGNTTNASITSLDTIKSNRKKFISDITGWNTNVNILASGYPIITKVMFVKQTVKGGYEAWEWDEENEEFFQIFN
tara:strand:- start:2073 stop:3227 length:1155 start_codon:yes stop_codon:yes gene_type:complete